MQRQLSFAARQKSHWARSCRFARLQLLLPAISSIDQMFRLTCIRYTSVTSQDGYGATDECMPGAADRRASPRLHAAATHKQRFGCLSTKINGQVEQQLLWRLHHLRSIDTRERSRRQVGRFRACMCRRTGGFEVTSYDDDAMGDSEEVGIKQLLSCRLRRLVRHVYINRSSRSE